MKRVTGLGGVFFKSKDPAKLKDWYRAHLGIGLETSGEVMFEWREKDDPQQLGLTVWNPFPQDTKYFEPSQAAFMLNYRAADLDELLAALRNEQVEIVGEIQACEYGRFAWVIDPEGNRVELWEPPKADTASE